MVVDVPCQTVVQNQCYLTALIHTVILMHTLQATWGNKAVFSHTLKKKHEQKIQKAHTVVGSSRQGWRDDRGQKRERQKITGEERLRERERERTLGHRVVDLCGGGVRWQGGGVPRRWNGWSRLTLRGGGRKEDRYLPQPAAI